MFLIFLAELLLRSELPSLMIFEEQDFGLMKQLKNVKTSFWYQINPDILFLYFDTALALCRTTYT